MNVFCLFSFFFFFNGVFFNLIKGGGRQFRACCWCCLLSLQGQRAGWRSWCCLLPLQGRLAHSTLEHFGDTLSSREASTVWFSKASCEDLGQVHRVPRAGCFSEAPWLADIGHGASHKPSSGQTAGLGSLKATGMSWDLPVRPGLRSAPS